MPQSPPDNKVHMHICGVWGHVGPSEGLFPVSETLFLVLCQSKWEKSKRNMDKCYCPFLKGPVWQTVHRTPAFRGWSPSKQNQLFLLVPTFLWSWKFIISNVDVCTNATPSDTLEGLNDDWYHMMLPQKRETCGMSLLYSASTKQDFPVFIQHKWTRTEQDLVLLSEISITAPADSRPSACAPVRWSERNENLKMRPVQRLRRIFNWMSPISLRSFSERFLLVNRSMMSISPLWHAALVLRGPPCCFSGSAELKTGRGSSI